MEFTTQLQTYREQIEQGIENLVPPASTRPGRLHAAMRYSLLADGKRLRPILVLAAAAVRTSTIVKQSPSHCKRGGSHGVPSRIRPDR